MHIPFKLPAVRHALHNWPGGYAALSEAERRRGPRYYPDDVLRAERMAGETGS
jgi:hypothetical protein